MGSKAGKGPLESILAGLAPLHESPTAAASVTLAEYQNVCYVTMPASSNAPGVVQVPHPSEVAGKWFLIYCEAYETSSGDVGTGINVVFREGNGVKNVVAHAHGTTDNMTKLYDRLYMFSDGEMYHVFVDVTT